MPAAPMLDGLETEVAVARAPASRIVLRMVEVGGVDAAPWCAEKGHLPSTIVTHVTDEADATVAQAVFPSRSKVTATISVLPLG
ncbi:MAG: hypothetical protein M5U34_35360 [Chloroflexi bacterium]|nr:hypothetical protein [Chloroflexota bacterium]